MKDTEFTVRAIADMYESLFYYFLGDNDSLLTKEACIRSYALSESFELIWDRNRLQVLETGFRGVTAAFEGILYNIIG